MPAGILFPVKKEASEFLITASHTADGSVVYARADASWAAAMDEAAVWPDEASAGPALAVARADEVTVCDPYLMPVGRQGKTLVVLSERERIRATGPTTRLRRPDAQAEGV